MHFVAHYNHDKADGPQVDFAEFDFRHNNRTALGVNDTDRASELAKGIVGKRLTYRRPNQKHVQA